MSNSTDHKLNGGENRKKVIVFRGDQRRMTHGWWFLVALGTLTLCSCQSLVKEPAGNPLETPPVNSAAYGDVRALQSPQAKRTQQADEYEDHSSNDYGAPLSLEGQRPLSRTCGSGPSCACCGPSMPPADGLEWVPQAPADEYLCDGGDGHFRTVRSKAGGFSGIELEDTVATYQPVAGPERTAVSNRVCVYAPRFAAIRHVATVQLHEQQLAAGRIDKQLPPVVGTDVLPTSLVSQPLAAVRDVGTMVPQTAEENQVGLMVDDIDMPTQVLGALLPHESLQIVEFGVLSNSDKPYLAIAAAAAIAWSTVEQVHVAVDGVTGLELVDVDGGQDVVHYRSPDGTELRLVKLASTDAAQPGETVWFTIRFDNLGDLPIKNVHVVDSLTTRLEYVPDSQQCSRNANFTNQVNDGESLLLKWSIPEALAPGEGGVIRFQCRVR